MKRKVFKVLVEVEMEAEELQRIAENRSDVEIGRRIAKNIREAVDDKFKVSGKITVEHVGTTKVY